ncbi:bifunctional histidinol-phosphatase/imidazoleglycerol-phosphate dehydratase HisB [Buchnera aphidicola]|uniref:bifunctional histidinol-phosphatase/imidazoleglycerol-phosphate dehydratase HisB n=1 Tax=Buchnera aphidicola TaxID=9 RepID=UPI0020930C9E|nr:bifunctional histidinol-phosphatase/imidazoleglycerol-phosphate dehydratase HisB [Buchnera aphidicola]USS94203.1 bifunctional histidinol-phosphatase/imidazoleglycerol-phosphate dehydratase HisB [Buchnera aphidicola (Sipha maydis)]
MYKKVLFLDRDGTLIREPKDNYQIDNIEKLEFEPNVIVILSKLQKMNYKFVMVSNQDGLGKKKFNLRDFYLCHNLMLSIFFSQGISFYDVLICPHTLGQNCECRKPNIGLVKKFFFSQNKLSTKNCFVIGDRKSDIDFAKNLNIPGILYSRKNCNWENIYQKLKYKERFSEILRKTSETEVHVKISLDNLQKNFFDTGIFFFNHMLEQISIHANISIYIKVKGDIEIDDHHIIEDVGIALGECFLRCLKNKKGICRYGFVLPMDESIASCILDISNRPFISFQAKFQYQKIGDLSTNMIFHFFYSLVYAMKITLHLKSKGKNDHHCAESLFKVFGKSLGQAILRNGTSCVPSSKGTLQ